MVFPSSVVEDPKGAVMFSLTDRRRIREESGCADETIRAFPHVRDVSRRRIERACVSLGISTPATTASALAISTIPATAA
jgi:hypothetical protein